MKAIKGVLLTCDSAVKQILITMNEKETPGFIVEDLDDFHILIKPEHEYRVRGQLEAELEKNTYSLEGST